VDGNRFDDVARSLHIEAPRRGVLSLVLGGALGLTGLAETAAKGKGKGKGKKKKKKKDVCGKTSKACGGKCGTGEACCVHLDCDSCRGLWCNGTNGGTKAGVCGCDGTDELHNGVCGTRPTCIPAGQKRGFFDVACCSGSEVTDIHDPANGTCLSGVLACLSDADCDGGSCRGYWCASPELGCNI
jgi:hypothetical protein